MNAKFFSTEQRTALMEAMKGVLDGNIKQFFTSAAKGTLTEDEIERAGRFRMKVTSADFDRYGESISLEGWDLSHYKNNPVVLFGHDYNRLPVGVTTKLEFTDDGLIAEGYFAPEEANPEAQQIRRLYDAGIIRASSVGLIVHERTGNKIEKAELLEWSFVTVPANPHALTAAKDLGMDVKELEQRGIITKDAPEDAKEETEEEEETVETTEETTEEVATEAPEEEAETTEEVEETETAEETEEEEEVETEEKSVEAKEMVESADVQEIISRHMQALRQDIDEKVVLHMNEMMQALAATEAPAEEQGGETAASPKTFEATHIDADLERSGDPEADQEADVKASEYGVPLTFSEAQMAKVLRSVATITNNALESLNAQKAN